MISGDQALSAAKKAGSRIFSGASTATPCFAATVRTGEDALAPVDRLEDHFDSLTGIRWRKYGRREQATRNPSRSRFWQTVAASKGQFQPTVAFQIGRASCRVRV